MPLLSAYTTIVLLKVKKMKDYFYFSKSITIYPRVLSQGSALLQNSYLIIPTKDSGLD